MDILFRQFTPKEGRASERPAPISICDNPNKTNTVDSTFTHAIYGFIYEGSGFYEVDGKRYSIAAPCVIKEWPGHRFRYGPNSQWSELYVRFDPSAIDNFKKRGIWSDRHPTYPIAQKDKWHAIHHLIQDTLQEDDRRTTYEALDRLIELLILYTLPFQPTGQFREDDAGPVQKIRELQNQIRKNPGAYFDWTNCAQELGMSESSFRRHWLDRVGVPPARYLSQNRMDHSTRLLLTTTKTIKEIAAEVGFPDPLHFSRKFTQHFGLSPKHFRQTNQT